MNVRKGEAFNTLTHLIGAILALMMLVVLVVVASMQGDPWKIVSFSIYGATLFGLYLASTLYHGVNGKWKPLFKIFDHQGIYLLIAGTYTPYTLVVLRGAWGWSLFGVVWGLAVLGIVLDTLPWIRQRRRVIPIIIYFLMGWSIVIAYQPMLLNFPVWGLTWLMIGGLCYTFGIVFYALSDRFTYAHGIWHLFVLGGSASHYVSILFYID